MRKCVSFDRDGIVNEPPDPGGYVCHPDGFHTKKAFLDALRIAAGYGYDTVVVTNQQGIGKGLYSEETLVQIHEKLMRDVTEAGFEVLAIYHCPHLEEEGCECRKPKPGMILQAAKDWNIDLEASWMVGDSFRDIDAGLAAGCRTVLVNSQAYGETTVCIEQMEDLPATLSGILGEAARE